MNLMRFFLIMVALAVLGVAAILYADADDAPGGMLFGALLIVGALALGIRRLRRRG